MTRDGIPHSSTRLGTRGGALALAQARLVAAALRSAWPDPRVEVVTVTTRGDVRTDVPLSELGGRGVFAAELERALRAGEVDLAVHSAEDLPSTLAVDMDLAARPTTTSPPSRRCSTPTAGRSRRRPSSRWRGTWASSSRRPVSWRGSVA